MLTAIWRGARRYLSPRLLFDALWMDEPLYVVFRQFCYPFTWNLFAVSVWLTGALVLLRQLCLRIASNFGVGTRPAKSAPIAPLMLNRSLKPFHGAFAARRARKTRRATIAKARPASKSSAPAQRASWQTRWRRKYLLHLGKLKHAAWAAQNLFGQ